MRLIDADALLKEIDKAWEKNVLSNLSVAANLITNAPTVQQSDPFGYFKAEPFGWTDCAETDEGAVALYEAPTVQREGWVSVEDRLPELKDDSVLAHFENGSIETIHIEDYFKPITNGFDDNGNQIYTKWYLHHDPKVTHWQPLPAAPTDTE